MVSPCSSHLVKSSLGGSLYAATYGNCTNPTSTVVLVNGLGGTIDRWLPVLEHFLQLEPDTQCITYEHRGHTASTHVFPVQETRLCDVLACDLADVITQLAVHPPVLVGHSMGSLIIEDAIRDWEVEYEGVLHISAPLQLPLLPVLWHERLYHWLARWSKRSAGTTSLPADHTKKPVPPVMYDLSFKRILFEVHTLGLIPFFLSWLCLLTTQHLSTPEIYLSRKGATHTPLPHFIFGSADLLVPQRVAREVATQYGEDRVTILTANHNMLTVRPQKLAELITQLLPR